jgi:hypothetical protein
MISRGMTASFLFILGKIDGNAKKYNICTIKCNENPIFLAEIGVDAGKQGEVLQKRVRIGGHPHKR